MRLSETVITTLKQKKNMVLVITAIAVITIPLMFTGCSSLGRLDESSLAKKKEMQFSDFTAVQVKDGFEVDDDYQPSVF